MDEKPTILFIALIPRDYSPYYAKTYGMERSFDLMPHKYAILTLVSWLRENGCEGHYVWVDEPDEEGLGTIDKAIELCNPNALGFSLTTEEIAPHYRLIELLKQRHPDLPAIVGGPHVTAEPVRSLELFPLVDFVAVGEGERTLTELLHRIAAGHGDDELTSNRGIGFRDSSGKIVITAPRQKISDINILPDPAYDLIAESDEPADRRSAFPIICSYGCYFFCSFCSVEHGNYRCVAPERVVDRIYQAQRHYGIEYFAIRDSFWPPTREWLDRFCSEVEKRKLKIQFHFQTRAGTLTDEHMKRLKKIGAQAIGIGVEAGDPAILKSIRKGITVTMARRTVAALNQAGIFSITFFIFGNKGENRGTIQASVDLAREMNPSMSLFHVLSPLPGAEAFKSVPDDRKDWWLNSISMPPSICDLSPEELGHLASEAFLRYPLRWAYFRQHVVGARLSPDFRRIARRIFFVHLRKYVLGISERYGPARILIRWVKSILRRSGSC